MATFTATTRVPTRPLSYANKEMAYRKELMIDYTNGLIYVVDENGNIIDVSQSVYEKLITYGDISTTGDNITIEVPNPDNPNETIQVTIQEEILTILTQIDAINTNIEEIKNLITQMQADIEALKAGIGDGSGSGGSIDPSTIITDATHQFLTQTQIDNLQNKVSVTEKIVSISTSSISGSSAPYTCTVTCEGLNPNYPSPLLDISYTNDTFSTNEAEEDAFYNIYRCKITTANQATIYFREKPTVNFNVRFVIYTPGI